MSARRGAPAAAAPVLRVSNEPAYVLHRYPWSETSLILDVFTRHHGRVALVAKGAKRPASALRGTLVSFAPLLLAYSGRNEVKTLRSAEWQGGLAPLSGLPLMSAFYLNELLVRMLAREDAHEALFDAYALALDRLGQWHARALRAADALGRGEGAPDPAELETILRDFELALLGAIGLLPAFDHDIDGAPLDDARPYVLAHDGLHALVPDAPAHAREFDLPAPGHAWLALARRDWQTDGVRLLAKRALRCLLNHHNGGVTLRTRQLLIELGALRRR
jgi:DNA repair protein RecO (recombination protein O)